jgi:hypothetical protein
MINSIIWNDKCNGGLNHYARNAKSKSETN